MRSRGVIGLVLGIGASLQGCAQGPSKADAAAPAFTPATLGEMASPATLLLAGAPDLTLKALGEQEGTLRITRVQEDTSYPGRWIVTQTAELTGKKPGVRILTMVALDDGSLGISREENRAEHVIVEFQPPLVVYPNELKANEPLEQKLRMIVHPMNNPAQVQNQGDAKQTIRFEGHERIETPLGRLDTIKIASTLETDLGGPQVLNETQEWLVPAIGTAAIKQMERTTLFGVRVRANNEWWVVERRN